MSKIKQLLLLACVSLTASNSGNAQTKKTSTVEIVQNFQPGKKYHYEVQRGKIDSKQPGMENIKTCTNVEFCMINKKKDVKGHQTNSNSKNNNEGLSFAPFCSCHRQ